jgi:hypothetical protein
MSDDNRPLIGTWNHLEASIGARGMGKSTYQCYRARQLQQEAHGAYVVGHSLGARLPTSLPAELGGGELPITYHETLAKLERGIRNRPDRWHILAPPMAGDGSHHRGPTDSADDLLQFATSLAARLKRQAWQKAHPLKFWNPKVSYHDVRCTPVIIIVDEGIALDAAATGTKKESNKWFLQMLYSLRHNHTALLYAIQNSTARNWQILEQSTAIHVFAVRHEWALNALRAAGATPDELERIRTQGKYQHVTLTALDVKLLEERSKDQVPE